METFDYKLLASEIIKMMPTPVDKRWLSLREAATYASIGEKKLRQLAYDKKITGFPDPDDGCGKWVFDKLSIDKYRVSQSALSSNASDARKFAVDILNSFNV